MKNFLESTSLFISAIAEHVVFTLNYPVLRAVPCRVPGHRACADSTHYFSR